MLRTENPRGIAGSTSDGLAAARSGLEAAHTTNERSTKRNSSGLRGSSCRRPPPIPSEASHCSSARLGSRSGRQHTCWSCVHSSAWRNGGAQPGSAELRRPIAEVFEQLTLPSDSETKSLVKVDSDLDGSAPSRATRRYSSSGCGDQDSLSASGIRELVRQRPKAAANSLLRPTLIVRESILRTPAA